MKALRERGHYRPDCVAAFPSVTPVCAASIATGTGPDRHHIPSMNWFHRGEERYVEYGTSFGASRTFGFRRSLTDTVYNMNGEHLSAETPTVFESLDDADLRTAGTTYLMYRGRHEHQPNVETALARLATQVFRKPVIGPREFFYADLFASRRTGCKATLGMPGLRDRHSGCVGAHLMEHDLFDFLLLSLPDNDTHSHRNGPAGPGDVAGRGRPSARASDARRRRTGRVSRRSRGGRLLGSLAVQGRGRDRPLRGVRGLRRAAAGRRQGRGARDRAVPGLALGAGLHARSRRRGGPRGRASCGRRSRSRASTSSSTARTTRTARRSSAAPAASCASGPAAT